MPLFHLIVLALIQGVTEFLPISSSGHLALYPLVAGVADQGLALDIAVHVGTLVAVMLYFREDVARLIRGGLAALTGRIGGAEARLFLLLVLATIPVVLVGLAIKLAGVETALRTLASIGWATLIGGALLYAADRWGARARRAEDWGASDAVLMGIAQCFALAPGASRSGVTMTMGRALGFDRVDAARLSMLMSIPTILAAGALLAVDLVEAGDVALGRDAAIGAALAFLSAYAALALMMRMLRGWSMTPFVIYRLILGAVLLVVAYG